MLNKLIETCGEWIKEYIIIKNDTFALAAADGDNPVGYICVTPRTLTNPLPPMQDAFIEVLGVHENYRRLGIGQHLVEQSEEWAKAAGFKQIRTHSNDQAIEAIHMWRKLNYALCPHDYHEFEPTTSEYQNQFSGYWVAKVLAFE